jgi:hypothetical protein
MFTKRFLLLVSILSLLLVSLAVASLLTKNLVEPVDTSWPPRPDYSHLHDQPLRPSPTPAITNPTSN